MRITDDMIAEDEKRWHARDVVIELGYCSNYMRDRKDMTNLDIRFYAYIMRKARDLLKAQEPVKPLILVKDAALSNGAKYLCGKCGGSFFHQKVNFCPWCGKAVKWIERE